MNRTWLRLALAAIGTVTLLSGCRGTTPTGATTTFPSPAPAPSTSATLLPSPSPTSHKPSGPSTPPPWSTGPVKVVHQPAVPPVPVLAHIQTAAHPAEGYDRIVFDFDQALPGYSVRYVSQVRADPSDKIVSVPGRRFLLIVVTPAQAHQNDGTVTVSGTHRLDLPMMRGYAVVGDYEGYVSIAIGLDDVVGYRVGELPQRIYLDVAA